MPQFGDRGWPSSRIRVPGDVDVAALPGSHDLDALARRLRLEAESPIPTITTSEQEADITAPAGSREITPVPAEGENRG